MDRRKLLLSFASAVPLLANSRVGLSRALSDKVKLGDVNSRLLIVSKSPTPLISVTRQHLAAYLTNLTGKSPLLGDVISDAQCQILLGDSSLASEFNLPLPHGKRGSFTVGSLIRGHQSLLIISGQTEEGVKRGVYYVMQQMGFESGRLIFPRKVVQSSPFFAGRGSHLGGFVCQVFNLKNLRASGPPIPATPAQLAWNHWDRWDLQRIPVYIDMLDFFGYNIIESEPGQLMPNENSSLAEKEEVERRRSIFVSRIRRNKMSHGVHFIGTFGDGVPYGQDTKRRYEEYYGSVAQGVGPYVDWVMTHWLDPGGWKSTPQHPCTVEVLQKLHMQIHHAFKKVSPKIQSILGLWALDHPGPGTGGLRWYGYRGVDSILKSDLVPREVGLAMSQTYRPAEAREITAAGHKASVWGWYLDDNELVYTMHVHTHVLQDYLQKVPDEARDLTAFHTLSDCQAETNLYSIYLGARMLWNPREDPEVYLREVARLVYGPRLEEQVFRGLKAIADVRCGKRCRGYWNPGYEGRKNFNGVVAFDQALEQSRAAWSGLESAQLDQTYVPPIRFHRPVEVLFRELKGHVEAVATYMQFLEDQQHGKAHPTEVPSAEGPFEYYERMAYLHPGDIFWPATVV